jgi:type VI secretion system secreted protein VgrG
MPLLELSFASKEDSLSVRHFAIREGISGLFEVDVLARSPLEEIDLESIVDQGAGFGFDSGVAFLTAPRRIWTGICSHMELVQAEPTGLSTYFIKIVPALWRTTLRRNNRIFQHRTIPDIVMKVLTEWQIEPVMRLTAQYLEHEYRVQYGETDFSFISRLLEEAGITYFFTHDGPQSKLVLTDGPTSEGPRPALPYVDNPSEAAELEFVTKVRLTQRVKPGRFTVRDFDFRNQLDYQLFQEARAKTELAYEQYVYEPGAFWYEPGQAGGTPFADDRGVARTNEKEGKARVTRELDAERRTRRVVDFETNVVDLSPGTLMTVDPHPRGDIGGKKLLVIQSSLEGTPGEAWTMKGEAVYADAPYRPERKTPRPRIRGVQSAAVVGPPGEEIHVDEFGRVRVQFHWDREGSYSDMSSCWIRVSQGWAGAGYGFLNLPRVGQEVLVEFFEGDPDRPVITGRVFSSTRQVPYKLPDNKTKSGWKTESSPHTGGFNELSFEDAAGREVIHIQAEKDFSEIIKNNQSSTVLNNRSASVTASDSVVVGGDQSFGVVHDQTFTIGKVQAFDIGEGRDAHIRSSDSIDAGDAITGTVGKEGVGYLYSKDQTILFTNGLVSIGFSTDGLFLDSKGDITIKAGELLKLSGKDIVIDGLPDVYFNRGRGPFDEAKRKRLLERLALIDAAMKKASELPPGAERDALTAAASRLARNNRAVEHARLAADVYNVTNDPNAAPEGWTRERTWDSATGFYAAAYRSNLDGRVVVAFRGTVPTTWQSWVLGNSQNVGLPSPQYAQAAAVGRSVQAEYGNNVEFTGHSLGGGLAATAAMGTGRRADTFNAAGVHRNSYLYYGLNPLNQGNVDNYTVRGDILTGAQRNTGLPDGVGRQHGLEAVQASGQPNAQGIQMYTPTQDVNTLLHPIDSAMQGVERHSSYVEGLEFQKQQDIAIIQGLL